MVRRLGLGKNNHLTYDSLALNPRYADRQPKANSVDPDQMPQSMMSNQDLFYLHSFSSF